MIAPISIMFIFDLPEAPLLAKNKISFVNEMTSVFFRYQTGLEKEYELEELCAHLEMRKKRVHPFVYRKITPSLLEISFGGKIFIFDFLNIK